jgi:hypothetical protein
MGLMVVGVSRALVLLGLVDGPARGGSGSSGSDSGSAASDTAAESDASSAAAAAAARRRTRRARAAAPPAGDASGSSGGAAASGLPPPRAAAEADDEGELWARPPGQRWLEAGARWLEREGDADGDAADDAESWEDEFGGGGEWDTSAAGEGDMLVDSGADD